MISQQYEMLLLEQQADLIAANNLLERKVLHFKLLIDFIKLIRFDLDEYSVLNNLLQVITKKLNYEYAFYYKKTEDQLQLSLTFQSDFNPKIKINTRPCFSANLASITNSDTYSFWHRQDPSGNELMAIYHQMVDKKIFNITQIKVTINQNFHGIIHLINGGLEDQIGSDQLDILSLLVEHYQRQIENIFLYQTSVIDERTQLFNVRYFNQRIQSLISDHQNDQLPTILLMIDIDHFKKFNDSYGHQAGDVVLAAVAAEIKKSCRNFDLVARYGGEEFAVLLGKTGQEGAAMVAERIRSNVEKLLVNFQQQTLKVTISLGMAAFPIHGKDPTTLVAKADEALYRAKGQGRNRVVEA